MELKPQRKRNDPSHRPQSDPIASNIDAVTKEHHERRVDSSAAAILDGRRLAEGGGGWGGGMGRRTARTSPSKELALPGARLSTGVQVKGNCRYMCIHTHIHIYTLKNKGIDEYLNLCTSTFRSPKSPRSKPLSDRAQPPLRG